MTYITRSNHLPVQRSSLLFIVDWENKGIYRSYTVSFQQLVSL
jgi:hypothetical protein